MKRTKSGMAITSIKTILANMKEGTWEEWKSILDIASAQLDMPRDARRRDSEYHVRHGKKKD